jgi:hypothetical protein
VSGPQLDVDDHRDAGPARAASAGIIPALDGVRGLAILLVLAHNLVTLLAEEKKVQAKQAPGTAINPGPNST